MHCLRSGSPSAALKVCQYGQGRGGTCGSERQGPPRPLFRASSSDSRIQVEGAGTERPRFGSPATPGVIAGHCLPFSGFQFPRLCREDLGWRPRRADSLCLTPIHKTPLDRIFWSVAELGAGWGELSRGCHSSAHRALSPRRTTSGPGASRGRGSARRGGGTATYRHGGDDDG